MMSFKSRLFGVGAIAALLVAAATGASAGNLVQNGDFNSPGATSAQWLHNGSTFITGWTNTDDYTGYVPAGQTPDQTWQCCLLGSAGPAYGYANGMVGPPSGNASLVIDGDTNFNHQGLYQSISGLVAGKKYTLTFWQAGGEEAFYFNTPTTQNFQVTLGDQTFNSPVMNVPADGFAPWSKVTEKFTWDGVGNTLTFLALGGPSGEPPFNELADVSLASVPEPATWALLLAGVAGVGGAARFSRRKKAATVTA
jgi:hypothetical protein